MSWTARSVSVGRAWRLTLLHRDSVLADAADAAYQRFVDALNHPYDAAVLSVALAHDIRMERHALAFLSHHPLALRDEASDR